MWCKGWSGSIMVTSSSAQLQKCWVCSQLQNWPSWLVYQVCQCHQLQWWWHADGKSIIFLHALKDLSFLRKWIPIPHLLFCIQKAGMRGRSSSELIFQFSQFKSSNTSPSCPRLDKPNIFFLSQTIIMPVVFFTFRLFIACFFFIYFKYIGSHIPMKSFFVSFLF